MHRLREALRFAFIKTLPILAGIAFLGIGYGIYMHSLGFSAWYTLALSSLIFAGSMEFVTASLLLGGFAPFEALLLGFMVNGRHLFYGISMLERFRGTGIVKPWLIFAMCDESFAINYVTQLPKEVSRKWFYFFVNTFLYVYWVLFAVIGTLFGNAITFNTKGIEFVLIALFVVLAIDQWKSSRNTVSSLIGLVVPVVMILIFGTKNFMIPSMIGIVLLLTLLRKTMEGKNNKNNQDLTKDDSATLPKDDKDLSTHNSVVLPREDQHASIDDSVALSKDDKGSLMDNSAVLFSSDNDSSMDAAKEGAK